MSRFFRCGDDSDSSDSSTDEDPESSAEEDSDDESDKGDQDSDGAEEDSDEETPSQEQEFWHFSNSDDSGCDMPRADRRRYRVYPAPSYSAPRLCTSIGWLDSNTDSDSENEVHNGAAANPRPICHWRGSRLINYIEQNVPAENSPGGEQADDESEEGWTKVVSRRGWNSSKRSEGKKSG